MRALFSMIGVALACCALPFLPMGPSSPPGPPARPEATTRPASPRAAACFAEMPPAAVLALHDDAISLGAATGGDFLTTTRWTTTVLGGPNLQPGEPVVLTYSFVPDGTAVPSGLGEPGGTSQLFAWLNGMYGAPAVWQAIFADELARWSESAGVTYVHEPNDDGAPLYTAPGAAGVRGDVRFAAKPIDGNGNVVAFNYYPAAGGDQVLDAGDLYFENLARDSRLLRNALIHELGHGLGLLHVCPLDKSKAMEPVVLTTELGPRVDDVRGAQRHYGDAHEPDDVQAAALDLGTLPAALTTLTGRSIHDAGDVDWIRFVAPPGMAADVHLVPQGGTYPHAGVSGGNCASSMPLVGDAVSNLGFELRLSGGTVLATVDAAPAGQPELFDGYTLPSGGGVFYLRVFADGTDDVQLYDLEIDLHPAAGAPFTVVLPGGAPAQMTAERPLEVPVQVVAGSGTPEWSTARVVHHVDGTGPNVEALFPTGGGLVATLPPCRAWSLCRWHVEIDVVGGGTVRLPRQPDAFFETQAVPAIGATTVVFADSFTSNAGWSVVNGSGLTDGAWQRGMPGGGGLRGDPPSGSDADGFCFMTDNSSGDSDVDGGATRLLSPIVDLTGLADARLGYDAWFTSDFGGMKNVQELVLEVSADGGTSWTRADAIEGSTYAWQSRSVRIGDFVPLTSAFRARFTASDHGLGTVVEAGIDAVLIEGVPATPFGPWAAGLAGLDLGGPFDLLGIDGDAGGPTRTVTRAIGQPFHFTIAAPPGAVALPSFAIFARVGKPVVADRLLVSARIGAAAFTPCLLAPLDPAGFVLADNLFSGLTICPAVLPSAPAPWSFLLPAGLPFAVDVTLQAVIRVDDDYRFTNALLLQVL